MVRTTWFGQISVAKIECYLMPPSTQSNSTQGMLLSLTSFFVPTLVLVIVSNLLMIQIETITIIDLEIESINFLISLQCISEHPINRVGEVVALYFCDMHFCSDKCGIPLDESLIWQKYNLHVLFLCFKWSKFCFQLNASWKRKSLGSHNSDHKKA